MSTEKLAAAIICNQIALHYNEELKHTPYYSKEIKHRINLLLPELMKKERLEFDRIFDKNDKIVETVTGNLMGAINAMLEMDFQDFVVVGNIIQAYKKDPKSIVGITNKVLNL